MAGEVDALVGSFAGIPDLYHPVRGRIRGRRAFETYVNETNASINERNVSVEDVERFVGERRGFGEAVLHLDGDTERVGLPVAIVAERQPDGRIDELRMYYSSWPLTGQHAIRSLLLQPDPQLRESDVVAEYQRALSAGDVDAIVATFEPDGYAREPAGDPYIHTGAGGLRALLRAVVLKWRGDPPRALRADRRQTRVRAGMQRRAVGQNRAAPAGRDRCLRSG
jgi:hypothetical protein